MYKWFSNLICPMFKWVGISNNIFQKFNITYKFHVDKSVEKTTLFEMRLMPIVYLQDAVLMGCYGRCNQQARCKGIHTPSMFPFPADTCILVIVWSEQLISSFKSGCFTLMRDHQMPIRKSGDPKRCGYADQVGCIRVKVGPCTGCIIYISYVYTSCLQRFPRFMKYMYMYSHVVMSVAQDLLF